jgi:hypothetical protein
MRWFLVVAVAVIATGCGSDEKTASETIRAQMAKVQTTCAEGINCDAPAKKPFGRSCKSARDGNRGSGVRTCWGPDPNHPNPTIERRTPSGWKLVTGPLKPSAIDAMWGRVWVSPDRRTLLAEWIYPCDSGTVVFVSASGGTPRVVTGEADWRNAPISQGLGWTPDGRARVHVFRSWRGHEPGTYLFDPGAPARDARPVTQPGC